MNVAPNFGNALRPEQREYCVKRTQQVNKASVELTRVCVIGGEWNGRGHEGANTFWEEPYVAQALASFDVFRAAVSDVIKACPYVHYDGDAQQVFLVSDDPDGVERKELDVFRLVEPDEKTLRDWYRDLKDSRDK